MALPASLLWFDSPSGSASAWSRLTSRVIDGVRWQVCAFYNPSEKLVIGKRTLPDGEWTAYTYDGTGGLPSLALPDFDSDGVSPPDNHHAAVVDIDRDGYVHFSWGHHNDALNYRKSNAPISSWTGGLSGTTSMTANPEDEVTYIRFFRDPVGNLYCIYRDGSTANSDWYLLVYDEATVTWGAASPVGARICRGIIDSIGPYLNCCPRFTPDWDGQGQGRMWLVGYWRTQNGTDYDDDLFAVYWTGGSNWYKDDGTAQTMPMRVSNTTPFKSAALNAANYSVSTNHDYECTADGRLAVLFREFAGSSTNRLRKLKLLTGTTWGADVTLDTIPAQSGAMRLVHSAVDDKWIIMLPTHATADPPVWGVRLLTSGSGNTTFVESNFYQTRYYSPTPALDRELLYDTGILHWSIIEDGDPGVFSGSATVEILDAGLFVGNEIPTLRRGATAYTTTLRRGAAEPLIAWAGAI